MKDISVRRFRMLPGLLTILLSAPAQAQQPGTTLDAITIVGERYADYMPQTSRSATRMDTSIKEIPQAVSVISQEVLKDLGETEIFSALEFGGVGRGNPYAGSVSNYTLRGFRSGTYYRNGMPSGGGAAGQTYGPIPDAAGIESLDVLRGPSSLTFGSSDPGGTFSVVTKQPLEDAAYELGLAWDEHGGRRGTADLTGPLNTSGTLLYRMNAAVSGGKTFRDHVHKRREYLAPRLRLQLAPQTALMLDMEWLRTKMPLDRGIPFHPDLLYGPPPRTFFHGEPGAGRLRNKNAIGQLRLEHALSDDWRLDLGLQRIVGGVDGYAVELNALQPDKRTFTRTFALRENRWNSKLAQVYVNGKLTLAGVEHRPLIGLEYHANYSRTAPPRNAINFPMPIDIYDPVYDVPIPVNFAPPGNRPGTHNHSRALIVQDQMRMTEALSVLAGLRYDRYHSRSQNTFANTALTPRLGATVALTEAASGYVSYSRSFKPNNAQDVGGSTLDPERGTSWEIGLKTDLFDQGLQITTALFHIVKTNVSTQDPDNPDYRIAAGEVRSQGIDVSLTGKIGARTRMVAYAGWVDAEVTKDNNPNMPPGTRIQDVPMRRASLMFMHELSGALHGLEVGAALQYVGARATATNTTTLRMSSYSKLSAGQTRQIPFVAEKRV